MLSMLCHYEMNEFNLFETFAWFARWHTQCHEYAAEKSEQLLYVMHINWDLNINLKIFRKLSAMPWKFENFFWEQSKILPRIFFFLSPIFIRATVTRQSNFPLWLIQFFKSWILNVCGIPIKVAGTCVFSLVCLSIWELVHILGLHLNKI